MDRLQNPGMGGGFGLGGGLGDFMSGGGNQESALKVRSEIKGLKLKHIHGYRGLDCRDNLFYVDDGNKIVYSAAGAGIVLDLKTGQNRYLFIFNKINLIL